MYNKSIYSVILINFLQLTLSLSTPYLNKLLAMYNKSIFSVILVNFLQCTPSLSTPL